MRSVQAALAAFLLLVFVQGVQARSHELLDPPPVVVPAEVGQDAVVAGIKRALTGRGWEVSAESDGVIDSTLRLREHVARIRVTYDARQVAFAYVDSVNLDYKEKKGQRYIHGNYIGWINYLIADLNAGLGGSGMPGDALAAAAGPETALPLSDADPVLSAGTARIQEVVAIGPNELPSDDAEAKKSLTLIVMTSGEKSKTVEPGRYRVKVGCIVGGFGLRFVKNMTVERGYEYEFLCGGSSAAARAKLEVRRTRQ